MADKMDQGILEVVDEWSWLTAMGSTPEFDAGDHLLKAFALMKRCQCGPMPDPEEIWELCQQLLKAGYPFQADRLGEYLPS